MPGRSGLATTRRLRAANRALLAAAGLVLLGAPPVPAASGAAEVREIVVAVADLDASLPALTEVLQWRLLERGQADATVARLWGLPVDAPIRQALVGDPAPGRDYIRLVQADMPARAAGSDPVVAGTRVAVRDIVALRARLLARNADIAADLQIVRLPPWGTVRALSWRPPGAPGLRLELFEPGAEPMSAAELREFTARGRFSTWTRFNNQLTGSVWWFPDGSARVKWDAGKLDERGTWTIRGNAVCTAWPRLREGRELCVNHYRLAGDTTQSFRAEGGAPDGIHTWRPGGEGLDVH